MSTNTAMFGWKRSLPGRERLSSAHFDDFVGYLAGLQKAGQIDSFEPVLLDPNAGGMIGFFLIRADDARLSAMLSSEAWTDHMVRAMLHLDQPVLVRAVSGPLVQERMSKWSACIPA
jgi:hypothetical protein